VSNDPVAISESEFLDKHAVPVYNLALRLTGNAADAEDLAQDSLIRALRALSNFRGDSQMSTWVYRITVNTWKNRVRSEKRRGLWKLLPLDFLFSKDGDDDKRSQEPKAPDAPLDSGLESSETGKLVQAALMALDEESRAVVVLREIQGQSYSEIATALDIPEGTVKSRLSRARETLKQRLSRLVAP
jgi:RNA polymerase sigma-70 factor (ECF subfamily)